MSKITLDINAFKALASDTRLDILRALDGKKMSLKDISNTTKLNKATLHEHLSKLTEVGLVKKKEREGHKWVYYKLSWKGESLLHPENTKIVILFTITFVALCTGIIQAIWYIKGKVMNVGSSLSYAQKNNVGIAPTQDGTTSERLLNNSNWSTGIPYQNPIFLYAAIACFIAFTIILYISIWKLRKNKVSKL